MSPPKILFFSDIHLDAKTDGRLRLNELEQVLDFCYGLVKSENVDVVVFGGDACDPDGPYAFKCVSALAAFDRGLPTSERLRGHQVLRCRQSRHLRGRLWFDSARSN
jgi:predicted MPP superfamily phosphohydrolase